MSRPGPKPASDELRNLKGDPGKRAGREVSTDQLPASSDQPPEYLVEAAQKLWAEIAPGMARAKLLRDSDRAFLALCVNEMATYWEMDRIIRDDGHVLDVVTYAGTDRSTTIKRAHPLIKAQREKLTTIKDFVDRLGLSPLSRTQLMAGLAGRIPPLPPSGDQSRGQQTLPGTTPTAESGASPDDPLNFTPAGPAN